MKEIITVKGKFGTIYSGYVLSYPGKRDTMLLHAHFVTRLGDSGKITFYNTMNVNEEYLQQNIEDLKTLATP